MNSLQVGKLPSTLLNKFLGKIKVEDKRVLLGPAIGEDVAVIKLGHKRLVAKTDPVTFATDLIGWYAVNVNANDIATIGVKPSWFLATILLPQEVTNEEAEKIFDQILSACNALGVALVGGHTEITYELKRPVVVGCMLAEAEDKPFIRTSGARPGDDIVITKGIAIEGTALLARDAEQTLRSARLDTSLIRCAAQYLFSPGISVLKEALIAANTVKVNSMHDPTEGGLAVGLWEIATAARVGIRVAKNKIPVLAECKIICDRLRLNPIGLLASGALIITLPPSETTRLLSALAEAGIIAQVIGKVVEPEAGLKMQNGEELKPFPQFKRDELARFLESRAKKTSGSDLESGLT
jgi:hydrogenase maturation factor